MKSQDLREKKNTQQHVVPSFDATIAEDTEENIETKPINKNEVLNFIFFLANSGASIYKQNSADKN